MATNVALDEANQVSLPVPADTASGDVLVIAGYSCVALTDRGSETDGEATVKFNGAVYADVDVAVAVGDTIYRHGSAGAYTYNKTSSGGTAVGPAISEVPSGGGRIMVKLGKL
jgi:hypothetical protein